MNDIHDEHTYCCDECGVPVVLSNLIPVGKEHWCRFCVERGNATANPKYADGQFHWICQPSPPIKDPVKVLDALYDFAFGDPEVQRRVRDRLAELGVHLPDPPAGRSTHRREGNKLGQGLDGL